MRTSEGLPDQRRGGGQQGPFLGDELVRPVPADQADAGDPALGGEGQDGQASGADARQSGFEGCAGGPQVHTSVPQSRLKGGQGTDRCLGPLRTPLGSPYLRPGVGLRRVEHADHQPVVLQLGEQHPVGVQRTTQRGDHHLADVTDCRGIVECGGQPLDPGDVVGAPAQDRGRHHQAQHLFRPVISGRRHPATQAQPAHFTGGATDAELQLPPTERLAGRLQDRHQRVHVLRQGMRDQGVHLAVEVVRRDPHQLEQSLVRLDQAGVRHQDEGTDAQTPQGGTQERRRRGAAAPGLEYAGDRVGVPLQEAPLLGLEAVRGMPHDDEAAQSPASRPQRQRTQRRLRLRWRRPALGVGGECRGVEPQRPVGAEGLRRG